MIGAQDEDGGRLSGIEMVAMMVMLGLTGPQTNATFIGNGILALLWDDPALMPRAVHELLRWCGPTQVVPRMRYASEELEIGGTHCLAAVQELGRYPMPFQWRLKALLVRL